MQQFVATLKKRKVSHYVWMKKYGEFRWYKIKFLWCSSGPGSGAGDPTAEGARASGWTEEEALWVGRSSRGLGRGGGGWGRRETWLSLSPALFFFPIHFLVLVALSCTCDKSELNLSFLYLHRHRLRSFPYLVPVFHHNTDFCLQHLLLLFVVFFFMFVCLFFKPNDKVLLSHTRFFTCVWKLPCRMALSGDQWRTSYQK